MTLRYTETQVISAVADLTPTRLSRFIQAEFVMPVQTDTGPQYREIDLARLSLLCELSDDFDLDEDALSVILSLIDQLHSARSDLRRLLKAVQDEPQDVRDRIARALTGS
jgi:chaperone modulatory protein CbpM